MRSMLVALPGHPRTDRDDAQMCRYLRVLAYAPCFLSLPVMPATLLNGMVSQAASGLTRAETAITFESTSRLPGEFRTTTFCLESAQASFNRAGEW